MYFKIEKISAFGQIYNMPFLRNEFSKIVEDLFTMRLFQILNILMIRRKIRIKTKDPRLPMVTFLIEGPLRQRGG